ncbi:GGDEF domain-containing protein [Neobacillus endophyticus]|uniref:GGDEF domain-containing protein n=1 Tax=Neobacillus endophyticus TaxID=2738405 RepID=UPI001C26DE5B|nr:GGDEF domain-containing protein [Neobacillus endophyticus]
MIILIGTIFPIIVDCIAYKFGKEYPFVWSLFILPSIFIMILSPKWKVVISSAIFFSLLKFIVKFYQNESLFSVEKFVLFAGSLVNWLIHLTIGYFVIKNQKLVQKMEEMALTDTLTGLNNRRYFDIYIEKAIPLSRKMNFPLLLLMIDIDYFKKINDNYGHLCGDQALKHIAGIMKRHVRETDVLIRFGGEEFSILLQETDIKDGINIAERIRDTVRKTEFIYEGTHVALTISIGLAIHNSEHIYMFLKKADQALYEAKANGRNQLVVFE